MNPGLVCGVPVTVEIVASTGSVTVNGTST
jgi:hypothetical protein